MAVWGSVKDIERFQRSSPAQRSRTIKGLGMLCVLSWSLWVLITGYMLRGTACTGVLLWPAVTIGLFLLVFFIIAISVIACTNDTPDSLDACLLLSLFIVISTVLIFLVSGTVAVGGMDFRGDEVREYKLGDCHGLLKSRVVGDPEYWAKLSGCVRDRKACDGMAPLARDPETGIFIPGLNDGRKISPIQFWMLQATVVMWIHICEWDGVDSNIRCLRRGS
ncbi:hypothetical protein ACP4OV_002001 [Aristida adscensionis]